MADGQTGSKDCFGVERRFSGNPANAVCPKESCVVRMYSSSHFLSDRFLRFAVHDAAGECAIAQTRLQHDRRSETWAADRINAPSAS